MERMMPAVRLVRWQAEPELVTVPVPVPGPGQVLLKVEAAGLCHSDGIGHIAVQLLRRLSEVRVIAVDIRDSGRQLRHARRHLSLTCRDRRQFSQVIA